ncbi:unnamed protein product [Cercospora beticola]|nr:unnamed protein product [Cercospora beticola]
MSPLHLPAPRYAAHKNNNNNDNAAPFASAPNLPSNNSTSHPTTSPEKLEKMSDARRSIPARIGLILRNAALSLFALYTISTFVPWSSQWARATHNPTTQVPCLAPVKEYASVSMEEDPSHWLLRQFPEHADMAACTNAETWCQLPSSSASNSSTTNVLNSAILAKGCASMEPLLLLLNMHPALVINNHNTSSAVPSGFDWTQIGSSDQELLRLWTALLAPDSLLPSNQQNQCERAILQAMRGLLWCEEFRFARPR